MQKWYEWLCEVKKKDEAKKMEEEHQQKVSQVIKSADVSAGLRHKITKPTAWRRSAVMKEEEDATQMAQVRRKEERMGNTLAM